MRTANRARLALALHEARAQTLALMAAYEPDHLAVPYLKIINPPLWEFGHTGYFQEFWCLRQPAFGAGKPGEGLGPSLLADADHWFDSNKVAHASRWHLDLPPPGQLKAYLSEVMQRSQARLADAPDDDAGLYLHRLSLFHEYMHIEAFSYTLQTLGLAATPALKAGKATATAPAGQWLHIAAGESTLGSRAGQGFIFDNEKFEHPVCHGAFDIASRPVNVREFTAFVEAGGYRESRWWDEAYWGQLQAESRQLPRYWRERGASFEQRCFDAWLPLGPDEAMLHVCGHEAEAYCRWAGQRLPSEIEWQVAAEQATGFEWGTSGWEWTASIFGPFAGFSPDSYKEYSEPWFHDHRVVRGGSFATPRGMVGSRYRNFYKPDRGDPFIGFRVCAL